MIAVIKSLSAKYPLGINTSYMRDVVIEQGGNIATIPPIGTGTSYGHKDGRLFRGRAGYGRAYGKGKDIGCGRLFWPMRYLWNIGIIIEKNNRHIIR